MRERTRSRPKTVPAVVGGGDAAVLEALYLARIVSHVDVFVRKDHFRAKGTFWMTRVSFGLSEVAIWSSGMAFTRCMAFFLIYVLKVFYFLLIRFYSWSYR